MTNSLPWLVVSVLLPLSSAAARAPTPERVLVVSGEAPSVLHVAGGESTVLVFDVAPLAEGTRVEGRAAVAVMVTERGAVLFPERDVSAADAAVLVARLSDGSRLRFQLVTVPEEVDARVHVRRSLEGATPGELRARLERCERGPGGLEAMAAFLAGHDADEALVTSRQAEKGWDPGAGPVTFIRLVEDRVSGVAFAVFSLYPVSALALSAPRLVDAGGRELRLLRAFPAPLAATARQRVSVVLAFEAAEGTPVSARFSTPEGGPVEAPIPAPAASPPAR